jgi:hypothetical protein
MAGAVCRQKPEWRRCVSLLVSGFRFLFLEEKMLSPPTTIIAAARSWLGTPYAHQASLKGVGCDCLGLVRGVWREVQGE